MRGWISQEITAEQRAEVETLLRRRDLSLRMRERLEMVGGQLDVRSEPAQGFHVNASIPLPGGVA